MSIVANIQSFLTIVETLTQGSASVANIRHDAYNTTTRLTASTTPAVSKFSAFLATMVAGELTVDCTALTGTNGAAVNANGLKLVAALFNNLSTTRSLVIEAGATNGLNIFGSSGKVIVPPGGIEMFYAKSGGATVGGSAKNIKLSDNGSGGTDTAEVILVFG